MIKLIFSLLKFKKLHRINIALFCSNFEHFLILFVRYCFLILSLSSTIVPMFLKRNSSLHFNSKRLIYFSNFFIRITKFLMIILLKVTIQMLYRSSFKIKLLIKVFDDYMAICRSLILNNEKYKYINET